jgi:hypothetical protein
MTRTEDLLRAALEGAATPPTRIADPLADLDRRVSRARRRLSITSVVAVFVVTAAVVVPLTLIGRGSDPAAPAGPSRAAVVSWATAGVIAVTAGGGSIWSLEDDIPGNASHIGIVRRDPVTGVVKSRWSVDPAYQFLAYGYGRVWVWGGGDGGEPNAIASVVGENSVTRAVHLGRGVAFDSVVFVAGHAWAAVPDRQLAVRIAVSRLDVAHVTRQHVTGISSVVALDAATLGIVTTDGAIEAVGRSDIRNYQMAAGTRPWVPAGGSYSWVSRGRSLYRENLTGDSKAGSRVSLPGIPFDVVADSKGGLYVEQGNPNDLPTVASLLYYSPLALSTESPQPTAVRDAGEVEGLAADPAGGVVYTDSDGALVHWTPAGAPLR